MVDYSIIIVNYKSAQLVLDCLKTVFTAPTKYSFEVIVVDNHSSDNSRELIIQAFPAITWLQMDYNSGFARANNAGIRQANGDAVLLLNSDTLVQGNAIDECYRLLKESHYIAAGVQLQNPDGSPQISGNFFMRGGLNHLMALPITGPMIRQAGLMMQVKKTNISEVAGQADVHWINGAFLMVKKEAIAKAGMLDEDFFLFSEEIEWCYRLGKTGKMIIYGNLHVTHIMGATVKDTYQSKHRGYNVLSDRKGFQLMLSGFVRVRKQFGVPWYLFHLAMHWFTIPVIFLIWPFAALLHPATAGQRFSTYAGFAGNVVKSTMYIFRIISNKPYFYKVL